MEVKESREIATNLKFGLAVALSLGGALYTYHRIKNIKVPPGKDFSTFFSPPFWVCLNIFKIDDIDSHACMMLRTFLICM